MPSDDIERLLKEDFDDLTHRLEKDGFERRMLFRLGSRRRARLGVIAFAGGLGAAFAASQFTDMARVIAPYIPEASATAAAPDMMTQLVSTLLFATAALATALVLRQEA